MSAKRRPFGIVFPLQKLADMVYLGILSLGDIQLLAPLTTIIETLTLHHVLVIATICKYSFKVTA